MNTHSRDPAHLWDDYFRKLVKRRKKKQFMNSNRNLCSYTFPRFRIPWHSHAVPMDKV